LGSGERWLARKTGEKVGRDRRALPARRSANEAWAHLPPERETQRESECFALWVSLFLSPFIRTAMRRTSGRTGPDPPYRFRFLMRPSFAPPYGGSLGGPAVTPYHFTPGRAGPPRPAHLSPERETQRESECFALWVSLSLSSLMRTAMRRTSGRTGPDPPYRFRFFFHLSFAPPYGGSVGAPGGHALPTAQRLPILSHTHNAKAIPMASVTRSPTSSQPNP
jgi:hypothetical protein